MTRSAAERLRVYGPPKRQEWLRSRRCLVCWSTPCEICHVRTGGMGRKADYQFTVPLCPQHHREQHATGSKTFSAKYGLDLLTSAANVEAAWQRWEEG